MRLCAVAVVVHLTPPTPHSLHPKPKSRCTVFWYFGTCLQRAFFFIVLFYFFFFFGVVLCWTISRRSDRSIGRLIRVFLSFSFFSPVSTSFLSSSSVLNLVIVCPSVCPSVRLSLRPPGSGRSRRPLGEQQQQHCVVWLSLSSRDTVSVQTPSWSDKRKNTTKKNLKRTHKKKNNQKKQNLWDCYHYDYYYFC